MKVVQVNGKRIVTEYRREFPIILNGQQRMLVISSADWKEVEPFKLQAEAEQILFAKTASCLTARVESDLVGFCGLLLYSKKAVQKSLFVLPRYRRQGIAQYCYEAMFEIVANVEGIQQMEATATASSLPLYLSRGAKIVKRFKTGNLTQVVIKL